MNRSGRLLAVASAALALTGCPKPDTRTNSNTGTSTPEAAKADPWDAAAKRLRKETDPAGVRGALNKLAEDLAAQDGGAGLPALTPEAEKQLAPLAHLAAEDLDVVRPATFGGLDAAYVAECLYLRDAAHAVDPVGLPPAEKAKAGFAWVCRQVFPQGWVTADGRYVPIAPPTFVLRRGWGSGLDRAAAALALFQQMGLAAGLVGGPDAADQPAGFAPPWAGKDQLPPGPFWAVAVRAGGDVLLFDPAAGRPFPAPLAQLKANPDLLRPWAEDKAHPWAVPADAVKQATLYLSVPLSAMAPRMAALEAKTKAELGANLAVDVKALRDRFTAPAPAGPGLADVKFWNPIGEGFAYPRVLASFLPAEDGGADRRAAGKRLADLYPVSLFPKQLFAEPNLFPKDLAVPARDRLALLAAASYGTSFLTPPTPRERIQRGQLQDATRYLSDRQDAFGRGQEQLRNVTPEQVAEGVKEVNRLFAELRAAEYPDPNQIRPNPPTDPAVEAARRAVEEFFQRTLAVAQSLVARVTAAAGLAEASYLLALAKHEEAERQQLRAEKAGPADARAKAAAANAWAEAANAWRSFLDQSAGLRGFPARADHARALAARADGFGKKE
jgi:hypothetical protein